MKPPARARRPTAWPPSSRQRGVPPPRHDARTPGRTVHGADIVSNLVVGALCYGLSLMLYISGAQQLGSVQAELIFATAPFWGVMLGWSLLFEPV